MGLAGLEELAAKVMAVVDEGRAMATAGVAAL